MKTTKQQFEDYKLVHDFMYPNEPLKGWIDEDSYKNLWLDDFNSIFEVIDAIEALKFRIGKGGVHPFGVTITNHTVLVRWGFSKPVKVLREPNETRQETIFKAIVEFIQFLNRCEDERVIQALKERNHG